MSFPHRIVPVFGSQRAYADLNFAGGSFGLDGRIVNDTALLPGFTFTGASLRTMFDSTGKLTYGPNNLALRSQTFDNATWGKTNCTVSADAVVAPDGTTTADAIVLGAGTLIKYVSQSIAGPLGASSVVVVSVYAKAGTHSFVQIINVGATSYYANFDVSTGTVGDVGANTTATITSVGDGWYRCSAYLNGAAAYHSLNLIQGITSNTSAYNASTTSTGTFYLWGAQLEAVTYRTTPAAYMPTTSAAYYGPRLVYDPSTLASLGILVEEARTNVCLWNRDLTNVVWTATNVTPVKDQTGVDGVANSASKITATAGNGTILQAITLASSARQQSTYIKRITGSGVIEMTTDNGTTWTAVTVTASWTRVTIPVQTLANPTVGFRIVTSGDAVAIDCVQNENGTGASSAIVTTSAAVTRAADVAYVTGIAAAQSATLYCEINTPNATAAVAEYHAALSDGGTTNRISFFRGAGTATMTNVVAVGGVAANPGTVAGVAAGNSKIALTCEPGRAAGAANGTVGSSSTPSATPAYTRVCIGSNESSSSNFANCTIKRITVTNAAKSTTQLQALTA